MTKLASVQKDKLMTDVQLVIADAEELLRMTADQAGEGAAELRGRVQGRLQQAKAELIHLQEVALAKAKDAGHVTDEFVHENPWKAIGAAAGVGLLLGLLMGRR
jgi:ElaB/YqjD/DUF883 family membrane-anchored ribosome-binding protein